MSEDFLIVTLSNYDGNSNHISTDYYYINKHNTSKVLLFSSEKYSYGLRVISSENEFILSSSEDADQSIVCRITEQGAVTEEIDGLNIDSDKMNEGGKSFNMQGFISDIKIDGAKVIISIKDVKMKEEDALAFGKTLNKDDLIDILIIDSNKSGPAIKAGDKVMVSCRYTKDNEILYTIGADIRSYEY
jgi:hypothetical protein